MALFFSGALGTLLGIKMNLSVGSSDSLREWRLFEVRGFVSSVLCRILGPGGDECTVRSVTVVE